LPGLVKISDYWEHCIHPAYVPSKTKEFTSP